MGAWARRSERHLSFVRLAAIVFCGLVAGAVAACTNMTPYAINNGGGAFIYSSSVPYNTSVCVWTATASPGLVQQVAIVFNLGHGFDRLYIYDGSTTADPLISTATGLSSGVELSAFSSTRVVTVQLVTDEFADPGGSFRITFTGVAAPQYCQPGMVANYSLATNFFTSNTFYGIAPYQDSTTCSWSVPRLGSDVNIMVTIPLLSARNIAPGDYINVYDGPNNASPLLATIGYMGDPDLIVISAPVGFIEFVAGPGDKFGLTGFQFSLKGVNVPVRCSGMRVINATTSLIGYNEPYQLFAGFQYLPDSVCYWQVWAPVNQVVLFVPNVISLTIWATLTVYDGPTTDSPVLVTPTASSSLQWGSSGRVILVVLRAQPVVTVAAGIQFQVQAMPQPYFCSQTGITLINSTTDLLLGTSVPNFINSNYPARMVCRWLIAGTTANQRVSIQPQYAQLRGGDLLTIERLFPNNSTQLLRNYTNAGPYDMSNINVWGNQALVTFVAGASSGPERGLQFHVQVFTPVTQCNGFVPILAPSNTSSATINIVPPTSGFYTQLYTGGMDCSWLLNVTASPGMSRYAKLTMSNSMDVRPQDRILIYDGIDSSGPLIGNHTGQYRLPGGQAYWATGRYMFVRFISAGPVVNTTSRAGALTFTNDGTYPVVNCPGPATFSVTNGQSYTVSSGQAHGRFVTCVYNFTRTDGGNLRFRPTGIGLAPLDTFIAYDGPTTASPQLFSSYGYTNNGSSYSSFQNSQYPIITYGPNLLVVMYFGPTSNGNNAFSVDAAASAGAWCSGVQTIVNLTLDSTKVQISPTPGIGKSILSGMNCTWIIDGAYSTDDPNEPTQYVQVGRMTRGSYLDNLYQNNLIKLTVYDGPTSASPILLNETSPWAAVSSTSGGKIRIEFTSAPGVSIPPTFGFIYTARLTPKQKPCNGLREIYLPTAYYAAPYTNWDGSTNFPQVFSCHWRFTAAAGSLVAVSQFNNQLLDNEEVRVYDGPNANSPLLYVLNVNVTTTEQRLSSGTILFVAYESNGISRSGGFQVRVEALLPAKPTKDMTIYPPQETETKYWGTATLMARPDASIDIQPVDYAILFPEPPQHTSVYQMSVPLGVVVNIMINIALPDGNLTILNNGRLLGFWSGVYCSISKISNLCGNVTLISRSGTRQTTRNFWRVQFTTASLTQDIPLRCRALNDVPCTYQGVINNAAQALPYVNCTIINNIALAATDTYSFPKLKSITSSLQFAGAGATGLINMPALKYINAMLVPSGAKLAALNWTSLEFVFTVDTTGLIAPSVNWPRLQYIWKLCMDQGSFGSMDLSSLRYVHIELYVSNNNDVATVNSPQLTWCNQFIFYQTPRLANIDISQIENFNRVVLVQGLVPTVWMPNVTQDSVLWGGFHLELLSSLVQFSIPNQPGTAFLHLRNTPQLFHVDMPSARFIQQDLCLSSARLVDLAGPLIENICDIDIDNCNTLASMPMPLLKTTQDFFLTDTAITSLSYPQLYFIHGDVDFENNFGLAHLDMCAINKVTGNLTVKACPALSCYETQQLFLSAGAGLTTAAFPDCSTSIGTFGCVPNVSRRVDQFGCGASLACIQAAINATYSGKDNEVVVPAGTYTGCQFPLDTLGKAFTLRGAGMGLTVIDCAGVGRPLVIQNGEDEGTWIIDMTFRNGRAATGGNALIYNASPTLLRVELSGGQATDTGGGVAVMGSLSAPIFDSCLLSSNRARSGGAVVASGGGAPLFRGGFVLGNTASVQGGAVLFTGATGSPLVVNTVFRANQANQGGALYADGPVSLRNVTCLDNVGIQFGGGLASVPGDQTLFTVVNGSRFRGNRAPSGGAVYGFSSNLRLAASTFDSNAATGDGGGVLAVCSPSWKILQAVIGTCPIYVEISDSVFVNNTAGGNGGSVSVVDSRLVATGGLFSLNEARSNGGAVHVTGSLLTLSGASLMDNNAQTGGAIYCEPYVGDCDVTASTFTGNSASQAGGALFLCTAQCPNTTAGAVPDAPLPPLLQANTFTADNEVGARGYGPFVASDPSRLSWVTAPDATIISGRSISSSGAIAVQITDSYDALVKTSATVLAVGLQIVDVHGEATDDAVLVGAVTAIATAGVATFEGVTIQAPLANTNASLQLQTRLTDAVTLLAPFFLAPCAAGQGRQDGGVGTGPIVCIDCIAGAAGSVDTAYICVACQPGSYAAQARSGACTPCAKNTHAEVAGSSTCVACPDGYSAPNEGTAQCEATGGLTDAIIGPAVGASVGVLILIIIGSICLWRLARRKTMQRYYLDADTTIRASGAEETPLMKSVKKMIGAASTSRVGGGMYADVFKARHENQWIALKVIKKEAMQAMNAQMEFRREAVALSRIGEKKHPGVVELVFFLERNPMCVGMEFCPNGTMKRHLLVRQYTPLEKLQFAAEAAAAMTVVHACNVVHLDLKTDNLLLDEHYHVKLADFGISRILDNDAPSEQMMHHSVNGDIHSVSHNPVFGSQESELQSGSGLGTGNGGEIQGGRRRGTSGASGSAHGSGSAVDSAFTPQYVDPLRLVNTRKLTDEFLRQSDVFSFGVVMWAIFQQDDPYSGVAPDELIASLKANISMRPPPIKMIHPAYERIMHECWQAEPSLRPSFLSVFEQLRHVLQHEFNQDVVASHIPTEEALAQRPRRGSTFASNFG